MQPVPKTLRLAADALTRKMETRFPALAPLAGPCFLNTIETTVETTSNGYFVITGDIPAMWLRDSAAQLRPYTAFAAQDEEVAKILRSVIARHAFLYHIGSLRECLQPFSLRSLLGP